MDDTISVDTLIETLIRLLALRDVETEEHTRRVAAIAVDLARLCGLSVQDQNHIRNGALIHDVGKICIPDSILLKKGSLTQQECEIIRSHTRHPKNLLGHIPSLRPAVDIALNHHERWDGSGYPQGLKMTEIPFFARIFAVADVWDALLSDRPYRAAWSHDAAFDYIYQNSGILFDPDVVNVFVALSDDQINSTIKVGNEL